MGVESIGCCCWLAALLQQIGVVVRPVFGCGQASSVFLLSTVFCVVVFEQASVAWVQSSSK